VAEVATEATITCPECRSILRETMPTNACQFFYKCPGCGVTLKPLTGDCCVFRSYSDHQCPPKQAGSDPLLTLHGRAESDRVAVGISMHALMLPPRTILRLSHLGTSRTPVRGEFVGVIHV